MNKYKIYMIFGITVLIISIVGSTYAYYKYVLASVNVNTITKGLDYYINYTKGTDITSSILNPSTEYTGGNSIDISLYKKDNTYDIYGHIYLDITKISSALSGSNALKYVVVEGTSKISEGTLGGVSSNESYLLAVNIPLKATTTMYTVYLWFDETVENASSAEDATISATVRCEASMKVIDDEIYSNSIIYKIKRLNKNDSKKIVINNNINYQYTESNGLMTDASGNIRYYGANPNNYVYFNCDNYGNQSSSTCELWRIIGIVDGKVKIVRKDNIGIYSWDNSGNVATTGNSNWPSSRLMKLLNPNYESEYGGSLYWNRQDGSCYSGATSVDNISTCNMGNIGLKNDTTRNMISESTWYLRGTTSIDMFPNVYYNTERVSGNVYAGNDTEWNGYVALASPSDYGYAADLSKCNGLTIYNYNSSNNNYECRSNNWLYTGDYKWLLAILAYDKTSLFRLASDGQLRSAYAYSNGTYVYPTVYLDKDVSISSGDGTSGSPYNLHIS